MDILYINIILLILCFLGLSWFAGSDAPYVPTKMEMLDKVLKAAGVKRCRKFYELGSGDGRVVFQASLMGAESYGIEQSLLRVFLSQIKAYRLNLKTAHFVHGNVFKKDYKQADIVYIYLLQKAVDKLEKKLQKELKQGSMVITQTYHFKSCKPFKKIGNFNIYSV